jgi:phage shock protein A
LQARVESFRTQKETIKATFSAAEAQTKIGEAFSGLSNELGDVGMAIQRAEDKTLQMQARAGAIDELLASGALDDATGRNRDSITVELERMASQNEVDDMLESMRREVAPAAETPALEQRQDDEQQA